MSDGGVVHLIKLSKKSIQVLCVVVLVILISCKCSQIVHASTISEDPQFIVVNFSDKFYFADWGADEASWEAKVKPDLLNDILEMKRTLGTGTNQRKLAWSTLLEYTDFPMDTPSEQSRYVIQAKRIMQLAEAAELPVYMPLNGFQWWNEVPELWNHWDSDGDQTPGCENENYKKIEGYAGEEPIYLCKFPKLRDEAFRKRFIAGYNPDNKWNVEWQDWQTPMRLNWRNWGGGGLQLAPPPNLIDSPKVKQSYVDFQTARFDAIVTAIAKQYQTWSEQGKGYLFAGLTIGTEVSLNASVTKQDEFEPYGYRGIQDILCEQDQMECGKDKELTSSEIHELRQKVVYDYLNTLAFRAVNAGIPKQRVYTHVWSEAVKGERRYENYFAAAVNFYSRPTLSLYGYAQDPGELSTLQKVLKNEKEPIWGASEFSTDKDAASWTRALRNTMSGSENPAQVIDIYNWKEHKDTEAVTSIKTGLKQSLESHRQLSEILPKGDFMAIDPTELNWELLSSSDSAQKQQLFFYKTRKQMLDKSEKPDQIVTVEAKNRSWNTDSLLPGFYQWYVQRSLEQEGQEFVSRSVPMRLYIPLPLSENTSPWWVKQYLRAEEALKNLSQVFSDKN